MYQYAQVVPLTRLPRAREFFDYHIPESLRDNIRCGTPVLVSFRGKPFPGIVVHLSDIPTDAAVAIRDIIRLIDAEPLVDESALEKLLALAKSYAVSPATFLYAFLPSLPRQTLKLALPKAVVRLRDFSLPRSFLPMLGKGLSSLLEGIDFFFRIDDNRFLVAFLARLAIDAYARETTLHIFSPYRNRVIELTHILNSHGIPVLRMLPTDGIKEQYTHWCALSRATHRVSIGTRAMIAVPRSQRTTIVLLDETSDDWKQEDANPRYDARYITEQLCSNEHHTIIRTGFVPRPTTAAAIANHTTTNVDLSVHPPLTPTLIDLRNHVRAGNRTALTDQLQALLLSAKRSVLFVHRRGTGSVFTCRDCTHRFSCPRCESTLATHKTMLRCGICSFEEVLPTHCPKCKGVRLSSYGTGTEQVEAEVRAIVPSAKILRIDSDTEKFIGNIWTEPWDVLIGTKALLHTIPLSSPPPLDLVAIVEGDTGLYRSDFRAEEKFAAIVGGLTTLALMSHASFVIQTAFPELPLWQIARGDDSPYLTNELATRRDLNYPPAIRMIKLIMSGADRLDAEHLARETYVVMKEALIPLEGVTVSEPFAATPPSRRGTFRNLMLIRFPNAALQTIESILATLTDQVAIDLDPIDISW